LENIRIYFVVFFYFLKIKVLASRALFKEVEWRNIDYDLCSKIKIKINFF